MPTPEVVRLSLQHATDLANKVDDVTNAMATKWLYISQGLDDKITQVSREIKNLQAQGKPVTEAWLNEQKYYKSLQEQARNQIANYVDWSQNFTETQVLQAALMGINDASSMYMYSTSGMGYFKGIPAPQIESIQALTIRDAPLGQLFQSIKPSYMGVHPLTEALMNGLAMGMPMTEIAKLMKDAVNMPYSRSVLIARTEVNRAHRSAALRTYQEYDVPYYRRMASRGHACFACMMLDGTLYTSKEALDDHPNGACAMVPVLDPNDPSTDWEHGEQRFEKMSEEEQRRIMGNNYYDSWKRGDFGLKDVTIIRQNPIWGGSPGMRPLKDLSPNWRQYVPKRVYTPRPRATVTNPLLGNLSPSQIAENLKVLEVMKYRMMDVDEKLVANIRDKVAHGLLESESKSLTWYTGSDYRYINRALRNGNTLDLEQKMNMVNMDAAFKKLPALHDDVYAFRNMGDWKPNATIGDKFVDPAYTSSTIRKRENYYRDSNTMEIFVPRGSRNIAYVEDISQYDVEKELLFNRNGVYSILDIQDKGNGYFNYKVLYMGNLGD